MGGCGIFVLMVGRVFCYCLLDYYECGIDIGVDDGILCFLEWCVYVVVVLVKGGGCWID